MVRRLLILAVLAASTTLPHLVTASAVAAPICGVGVRGDIDGNGVADIVAGAIRYSYPRPGATSDFDVIRLPDEQRVTLGVSDIDPTTTAGRLVQAALGDLDGDGCADLVFGADDGDTKGAARLYLVPGSPDGPAVGRTTRIDLGAGLVQRVAVVPHPTGGQVAVTTKSEQGGAALHVIAVDESLAPTQTVTITAASLGIAASTSLYGFGASLAASGHTIVVGNPHERKGATRFTVGAVHLFTATEATPMTFRHSRITEDSAHIPGRAVDGSSFGERVDYLDGRLIIGAPDKQVPRFNNYANNAGQVFLLRWNEATRKYTYLRSFNQDSKGVPGIAEPWDRLGYEVMLARGLTAPGSYDVIASSREGIGAAEVAGSVLFTNFDKGGYRTLSQASAGVPGDVGYTHWFGHELSRRSGNGPDIVMIAALDSQEACGGGLLMQTAGTPLATTTWTLVPPAARDVPCPDGMWPYTLPR